MCFDVISGGSDIEEIASLLRQIKDKAHKEGQKKTEQTISSFTGHIHPMVPTTKAKFEKESMKATHDKFCKDQASPVQNFKDLFSKFEYEKETLLVQDELLGINVEEFLKKMVQYEGFLKNECTKVHATHELHTNRISKNDNSFSILCKSIRSFLVRDDEF